MSINLISWRPERRKRLQKDFLTRIGLAALLAAFVVVVVAIGLAGITSGQNGRNAFLDQKIKDAQKDIDSIKDLEQQRSDLLARKHIIEDLQADRDELAHIFYELATNANDGVVLTGMEYTPANVLEIHGRAISNSAVAQYARNLEQSVWLTNPEIMIIQAKDGTVVGGKSAAAAAAPAGGGDASSYTYTFMIHAGINNPNAPKPEDDEDSDAKGGKAAGGKFGKLAGKQLAGQHEAETHTSNNAAPISTTPRPAAQKG